MEAARAKLKADLDKELAHYQNLVESLGEDHPDLIAAREHLDALRGDIDQVDNRLANRAAGYVYVISNLGTMGANVVKIGMTRRLAPMDRVKELGDASVPFGFDVHALFFSDDAREIERSLHERFADQRANKVNLRREFF